MSKPNQISIELKRITPGSYGDSVVHQKQERNTAGNVVELDLEDLREKFEGELDRFFEELKQEKRLQLKAVKQTEKAKQITTDDF